MPSVNIKPSPRHKLSSKFFAQKKKMMEKAICDAGNFYCAKTAAVLQLANSKE